MQPVTDRATNNQQPTTNNRFPDAVIATALAAGTAAVVIWQNSRLAVLWDLSYILENATRIAAGDIPYRDFPFPYAPLTFVTQAAIIRLFGRHYALHVAYAAGAGAVATALTYLLVRTIGTRRAPAALLCLPLIVLGIYCIYPHPFYDPDACLAVLIALLLIRLTQSQWGRFGAGVVAVVPLFIKQNIGLPFLAAVVVLFAIRRDLRALAGVAAGLAIAIGTIAATAGLQNYIEWTIRFAAQRRLPTMALELSIYDDRTLWWWLGVAIGGGLVAMRWRRTGVLLATLPWIWTAVRFFITDDPNEREINFLLAWPLMIICAAVTAIAVWRREERDAAMPLLAIAAIEGAFLSQITWGSTYGIWPLLVVLLAFTLSRIARDRFAVAVMAAAVIAAVTLLEGIPYVVHGNRLAYAKVSGPSPAAPATDEEDDDDEDDAKAARGVETPSAPLERASLPPLRGLAMRGPWIADFEELVAWTDRNIPRGDAILCMPGEDLFYFTTGRRPQFPVLMFDHTVNPYTAGQIAAIAQSRHVRWVIVKRNLQINGTPMENLGQTLALLRPKLSVAARLRNYDVYAMR